MYWAGTMQAMPKPIPRKDGDCAADLLAGRKTDAIELRNNTLIAKAYGKPEIQEGITAITASHLSLPASLSGATCA